MVPLHLYKQTAYWSGAPIDQLTGIELGSMIRSDSAAVRCRFSLELRVAGRQTLTGYRSSSSCAQLRSVPLRARRCSGYLPRCEAGGRSLARGGSSRGERGSGGASLRKFGVFVGFCVVAVPSLWGHCVGPHTSTPRTVPTDISSPEGVEETLGFLSVQSCETWKKPNVSLIWSY